MRGSTSSCQTEYLPVFGLPVFDELYQILSFYQFLARGICFLAVPSEEVIIRKERAAGSYRLSAYFFAKCLSEIPLVICHPIMFLFLFYWLCGLNPSVAFLGQALNIVATAILAQV